MIAAYAFLAMFAVQVFAASVLYPNRLIKYTREWAQDFGSERFAQMYPGDDYVRQVDRAAAIYRKVTIGFAVIGAVLLAWLFTGMPRPDWADVAVRTSWYYFMLQMSPMILLFLYAGARYKALNKPPQEPKRTATLERRRLFDFISPLAVFLAVLSYLLFVAFSLYVDLYLYNNPTPSRYCYIAIANATAIYAIDAIVIYKYLYGKRNSLVTHEGRLHRIGMTVKSGVYGSIATVWFFALVALLRQLELQSWLPFAFSAFWVITSLLLLMTLTAPPRKPEADGLGATPVS